MLQLFQQMFFCLFLLLKTEILHFYLSCTTEHWFEGKRAECWEQPSLIFHLVFHLSLSFEKQVSISEAYFVLCCGCCSHGFLQVEILSHLRKKMNGISDSAKCLSTYHQMHRSVQNVSKWCHGKHGAHWLRFMQHGCGVWTCYFDCGRTAVYQHNYLFHPEKKKKKKRAVKSVCPVDIDLSQDRRQLLYWTVLCGTCKSIYM